jgi:uncharacterized protein (TIGR02996 family)
MSEEESGLLNAIAHRPDEDAERLIYADWLEDHGDPNRAELIRLQCNLERGIDVCVRRKAFLHIVVAWEVSFWRPRHGTSAAGFEAGTDMA